MNEVIAFTPELIAGVVGIGLSWAFSWFPVLRVLYAQLKAEMKSGIMLGLMAIVSITIYLLAYYNVIQTSEPITIIRLVTVFFVATTLNQEAFNITPQARDVKDVQTCKRASEIAKLNSGCDIKG